MVSIGPKKYRNMQEQVGFNTEQIEKIFQTLDGLNVQDNVVVISDISDLLSQEELEIVTKEVAFIIYNNQLYIKKTQDVSSAYFDIVFTISSSGGVISFASKEITVTLSNGALALTTSTNSTYDKNQLDSAFGAKADITYVDTQLALKANLSGADFTGGITSPSIIQTMTGFTAVKGGFQSFTNIYTGIVQTGNKITFVVFGKFTYDSSSTSGSEIMQFGIPSAVGLKLFPYNVGGDTILSQDQLDVYNGVASHKTITAYMTKQSNDQLKLFAGAVSAAGLTNATEYFFRWERTFLLSDNLAS